MKNKRRLLLLILGLILIGVVILAWSWYWYIASQSQNAALPGSLSERATEFIRKDSSQGTGLWSEVDVLATQSAGTTVKAGAPISTPCFTAELPVTTVNHQLRQEADRCVFQARSISPPGYLVLSQYLSAQPTEDSGLVLRRKENKTYREEPLNAPYFDQAVLFISSDSATAFAWKQDLMFTVALTNPNLKADDLPNLFSHIVNSYQFVASSATTSGQLAPAINP